MSFLHGPLEASSMVVLTPPPTLISDSSSDTQWSNGTQEQSCLLRDISLNSSSCLRVRGQLAVIADWKCPLVHAFLSFDLHFVAGSEAVQWTLNGHATSRLFEWNLHVTACAVLPIRLISFCDARHCQQNSHLHFLQVMWSQPSVF